MAWSNLAANQAVSFTDAQTGGFTLKPGQTNSGSNKCMTKAEAQAMYFLYPDPMNNYTDNRLPPKSTWTAAPTSTEVKTVYYYFNNAASVCNWTIQPAILTSQWVPGINGLINGSIFYSSSSLSSPAYTAPDDSKWYFCLDGGVVKYYQMDSNGYNVKNVGTCA